MTVSAARSRGEDGIQEWNDGITTAPGRDPRSRSIDGVTERLSRENPRLRAQSHRQPEAARHLSADLFRFALACAASSV
jgi:hypothetical protein